MQNVKLAWSLKKPIVLFLHSNVILADLGFAIGLKKSNAMDFVMV